MPKFSKASSGNNPGRGAAALRAIAGNWKKRRAAFIIAGVVVVLILVTVGISLYQNSAPFRQVVISVDDASIKMDYFLKRTRLADADPMAMLEMLTSELLIKVETPRYGIEVSPEDVDRELRRIAGGESGAISEVEFKAWYRQTLNENDLSDSEYREVVTIILLAARLEDYLAERVPTVADQIHLYVIAAETYQDAEEIRVRWAAGEDFADLAREVSIDEGAQETGGDLGWFPAGVLNPTFDYVTSSLSAGEVSQPVAYAIDPAAPEEPVYYLLMVTEEADARKVDDDSLQILKAQTLGVWISKEMKRHEIGWHGLNNGFDSETSAWINWQLSKE